MLDAPKESYDSHSEISKVSKKNSECLSEYQTPFDTGVKKHTV